jgi:hypothetical protein
METINVEEFKRNIKACLDQLPFAVTRRGKIIFICYGPEGKPVDIPGIQPAITIAEPVMVVPGASCEVKKPADTPDMADTVYVPDYVKPVKAPKPKSNAAPVVKSLLSGIVKQPIVSHHPCCSCGVCKPLSDKLARL